MTINWDRSTIGRGSPIPRGFVVIEVDARSLIAAFKATDPDYAKFDKLGGVRSHVAAGGKLSLPQVGAVDGRIGFDNGRNRAALAAELGERVPIVVARGNVAAVKKLVAAHAETATATVGPTANVQLSDAMVRHQTYLLRYSGGVRNRMQSILDDTEGSLQDKIAARLANASGLTTPAEVRRMRALIEEIEAVRGAGWQQVSKELREEMLRLSIAEVGAIQNTIGIISPVKIDTVMPSNELLRSIALARPFEGRVLKDWVVHMAADDLRRVSNAIQLGMTAGESMQDITRRVTGTHALRGADGITELARRHVDAITRTAVMHVAGHSRDAFFQANQEVIDTERFVATLDARTTPICRGLDGKAYPVGTGPRPPLHFKCRSLRVANLDGALLGERPAKPFVERELLEEWGRNNGVPDLRTRDGLPRGTKGAYDKWSKKRIRELIGTVPADTTYGQWLARQSRTFQDDTLGVTRAKLFRDGKLPLDRFTNRNGDELTLKQLASREADAFRAAGLDPAKF